MFFEKLFKWNGATTKIWSWVMIMVVKKPSSNDPLLCGCDYHKQFHVKPKNYISHFESY
jgi:hypothetical protein